MQKPLNHIKTSPPYWVATLWCIIYFFGAMEQGYSQNTMIDELYGEIQRIQEKNPNYPKDTSYINSLTDLAYEYRFTKSDSMFSLSKRTLKLSKAIDFVEGEFFSLTNLGLYYVDRGSSSEAISTHEKALALAESNGRRDLMALVLNDLASEYSHIGDHGRALNAFTQGIEITTEIDDKELMSILYENLAQLYTVQKEYESAFELYEKILKLNAEIGDDIFSAETMSNLAALHTKAKNYDYAMFNINKSIEVFETHKILDWLAYSYSVKGKIYLEQKKYKWALHWFEQCDLVMKNVERGLISAQLYNGISNAHLGLGDNELAMQYATKGFKFSKKLNYLNGYMESAKILYETNKNLGNFKEALNFHEVFLRLSDSISKEENLRSLGVLKNKMDYEQQQQELIATNDKIQGEQRNLLLASAFVLLLLLGITIPLYFNQKKQEKLYLQLKGKTQVLHEREKELGNINKTKDRLFSIIGHDLRGPIGALQSLLNLFSTGQIDKNDLIKYIPKLKGDVDHIFFTLNNLLTWGVAQMNGTVTRPKVISVKRLVNNNINFLSEMAAGKSLKMIDHLPDSPMILADEDQIDIVIRNLISNSIKFTPENGLITVEAQEENDYWVFMVRDTGVGMSEEIQKKIFNNKDNMTTYGTNNEKGTGLGLSLCKEMVEKNGGEIWVKSEPNKGSTFFFKLPKVAKKYKKAS